MKSATTVLKDVELSGHRVNKKDRRIECTRLINEDLKQDIFDYLPGWLIWLLPKNEN
jgi:hypothetical protein